MLDMRGLLSSTVGAGTLIILPTRVGGAAAGSVAGGVVEGAVGIAGAGVGAVRTFGLS